MQSPASCHVIYVNRKASRDRLVRANASGPVSDDDDDGTRDEVQALLEAFGDGASLPSSPETKKGEAMDSPSSSSLCIRTHVLS